MFKGMDGKQGGKGKRAEANGKGKSGCGKRAADPHSALYLAVPDDECDAILSEGFTCRRRSYVPVSASPSAALFAFSRSAQRAGARRARTAVVLKVRSVPASVKCLATDEGFRLETTHLPAYLLSKVKADVHASETFGSNDAEQAVSNTICMVAAKEKDDALAVALADVERMGQIHKQEIRALERRVEDMESSKRKAMEAASAKASKEKDEAVALALVEAERMRQIHAGEVLVLENKIEEIEFTKQAALQKASVNENKLKQKESRVARLESELLSLKNNMQRLKHVIDKFACVARPQYWKSQTHDARPSFEVIDVTSHGLMTWLSAWMWWSSHPECKIGKVSPWVTRVRRVESDAHWLRFQTQIVSMRTYHKQHRIESRPIEPYVWYPPTNNAPHALLDSLQSSVNEHLLFHGTSAQTAEDIVKQGFDIVRSRQGLYGPGFYFAQEFCKSAQYGREGGTNGKGTLLVCRVALGDVKYHRSGPFSSTERPKRSDGTLYDAFVVEPRSEPDLQVHREFVVYESAQIYVEYIVDYDIPSGAHR